MFIKGMLLGIALGSFSTLILYACIIIGKQADERTYKNIQ